MHSNLKRVSNWIWQLLPRVRAHLDLGEIQKNLDLTAKICFSIFQIILIVLVVIFLAALANFIFSWQDGITIMPFDTSGMGEECSGKAVADRLGLELQRIKSIHAYKEMIINSSKNATRGNIEGTPFKSPQFIPPIISNEQTMEKSLSEIGTVDAGPASISIGQLLLMLRSITERSASSITGSMEVYGSNISIVASMEEKGSKKGTLAWERTMSIENSDSSKEEMVPYLINDLAYKIFYDIKNDTKSVGSSRSWISFKYSTEGWNAYWDYNVTNDASYLNIAEEMMRKSLKEDPRNIESAQLLATLQGAYQEMGNRGKLDNLTDMATEITVLSGDAWYNKGLYATYAGHWMKAAEAFDNAIKTDPKNKLYWVSKSFALNKLTEEESLNSAEEALNSAEEAIRLDPNYADAWHEKANALYNLGNYADSIEAHQRSIDLDSSIWWYYYDYALPLWQMSVEDGCEECYEDAIVALDNALSLGPDEGGREDIESLMNLIRSSEDDAMGSVS